MVSWREVKAFKNLIKVGFEKSKPTDGAQCGLGIMDNSVSNVKEEKTSYEGQYCLRRLSKCQLLPCSQRGFSGFAT